jgi:hypothetical protein
MTKIVTNLNDESKKDNIKNSSLCHLGFDAILG